MVLERDRSIAASAFLGNCAVSASINRASRDASEWRESLTDMATLSTLSKLSGVRRMASRCSSCTSTGFR